MSVLKYSADIIQQLNEMMNLVNNELQSAYDAYAESKSVSTYMQNMKSSVLSKLIFDAEGKMTERKVAAESSDDYRDFLQKLANAIGEEQKTRGRVEVLKTKIDALRTAISLHKMLV